MAKANPGEVFGRLTILEILPEGRVRCVCECGREHVAFRANVAQGKTKSCGCTRFLAKPTLTHGMTGTAEYRTWRHILIRCENRNAKCYYRYGGIGIKVCDRWHRFENFLEDMGIKPSPKHSIDRIDVAGNYEPSNCRWATPVEQARNKRNNRLVEIDGEVLTAAEWGERSGVNMKVICSRLDKGWDPRRAVFGTVERRIRMSVFGETLTYREVAAKYGFSVQQLKNALRYHADIESFLRHKLKCSA